MVDQLPASFQGALAPQFQGVDINNDLASGVQSGFGLITFKGKVWTIKYRGDERSLMRPDGDGPVNSIEVVIVKASPHISKVFYENGYVEGSNSPPDCFSTNGITPDVSSAKKQAASCAACPKNAWGSRITPQGKAGKACSDAKRLAVVPLSDIQNEAMGGPMLLRVPAASLQEMAMYSQGMAKMGYPYYAVATRISFDPQEAYPKFQFKPIRPLTAEEADMVIEHQKSVQVDQILADAVENVLTPAEETPPGLAFEQPTSTKTSSSTPSAPPSQPETGTQKPSSPGGMEMGAFGAMTSEASSTPAPPAEPPTTEAPSSSGQPTASPQQTAPSTPSTSNGENSDGGASTAPSSSGDKSFEDDLDAKLAALLPS